MRALDRDARAVELANLPAAARARFDAPGLEACAERVLARDLSAPNARVWLIGSAVVPDDYRDAWRALGLYPITGFGLAAGVAIYERDARARFADDAPPRGPVLAYRPPAATTPPRRSAAPLPRSSPAIRCRRSRAPSLRPSTRCSPPTRPCSRSRPRTTTIVPAVPIAARTARRTSTRRRPSSTRAWRGRVSTARCCRSSSTPPGSRGARPRTQATRSPAGSTGWCGA